MKELYRKEETGKKESHLSPINGLILKVMINMIA
jgi:hypothetical protein